MIVSINYGDYEQQIAQAHAAMMKALEYWRDTLEENKRLRSALEPFQRKIEALSLSAALGHIGREELWAARHAFKNEQSGESK